MPNALHALVLLSVREPLTLSHSLNTVWSTPENILAAPIHPQQTDYHKCVTSAPFDMANNDKSFLDKVLNIVKEESSEDAPLIKFKHPKELEVRNFSQTLSIVST